MNNRLRGVPAPLETSFAGKQKKWPAVERETTAGAQGRNAIQAKFAIAAKNSWRMPGLWPGSPPKNHAIRFIAIDSRLECVCAEPRLVG